MPGTMQAMPASWQSHKRKQTTTPSSNKRTRRAAKHKPSTVHQIQHAIESCLADAPDEVQAPLPEDILERAVEMLCDTSIAASMQRTEAPSAHNVPVVGRVYEERYMRECKHKDEAPCVLGSSCECMFLDHSQPFVGVQFQLPDVSNSAAGMCVVCLRKTTTLLFYKTIYNGVHANTIIQKHGNRCNEAGEYHPSAMLSCPVNGPIQCMPLPIVAHQRNRYSVAVVGGIKHIKQHGVYMEDFG